MRCPQCSHDNPDGVKFCGECGTRIEGLCPNCGTSNPPPNKFCHQCGQALAPPLMPAARFTSPQSYTPPHLVEKILTSQSAMDVIDGVAERLQDHELQRTFLTARPVQDIRERLVQASRERP